MVEQGTHKPLVASSNLALGTKLKATLPGGLIIWIGHRPAVRDITDSTNLAIGTIYR